MLYFRKFLVRIKREYNTNRTKLFLYSVLSSLLFIGIGCLADAFIPFNSWGNVIRTAILIPTSISMFIFGYALSLKMHYKKTDTDPYWIPFRARLSPTWRRRSALILGAFLIVGIYANNQAIGYTAISSLFVAIAIAMIAFIRTTKEEARREEFDIPDDRDIRYEQQIKKIEASRAEAARRKEARKRAKKNDDLE